MKIQLRHIGGNPASIIEATISVSGTEIIERVTFLDGTVSEDLIYNLRDVADELEAHNQAKKEGQ